MKEKRIRAVCPECAKEREIKRDQVGDELVCSGCGTKFCVEMELRRHRRPRTPTPDEIEERLSGDPGTLVKGSASGSIGVLKLTVLVVAFVMLAIHFDTVVNFGREVWAHVWAFFRDS